MPPRHTPFCILTHADTGGNSFHNSSVLPIYICREHFFVLRHAHALHLFDFAYFLKVEHETSAWGARIIVPALMIVATLA